MPAAGINLLVGANGQGKTNFLEAVFLISTLRSFRNCPSRELIKHGLERAELSARIERNGVPQILHLSIGSEGRRLWVGERRQRGVAGYLGRLHTLAFTPDDLAIVKGGPALRRRFLDRAAFLFRPGHLADARDFQLALRARNRMLLRGEVFDPLMFEAYNRTLASTGTQLSEARRQVIFRLERIAARLMTELSGDRLPVKIAFRPGWQMPLHASDDELLRQLECNLVRDQRRRTTTMGPQFDDFEILLDDRSARRYASQGQQRTAAIALLLALMEEVLGEHGQPPVLLLDDVSSELDADRRRRLFARVLELGAQVFVTTTETAMVAELGAKIEKRFVVVDGSLRQD